MAYYFYLGKMLCPVPPAKMDLQIKGNNKTVTLINEGEVNLLKTAGLSTISFDLLLPNVKYPFATYPLGYHDATFFLITLENLMKEKKPFQFIVVRTLPNGKILYATNLKVSLENYTIREDAREGFDFVASIRLKQYRDFGTKTCVIAGDKKQPTISINNPRSVESAAKIKSYTTKSNDTLWNIAKKCYGDGSKYTKIYDVNKGLSPNHITGGQEIVIPDVKG